MCGLRCHSLTTDAKISHTRAKHVKQNAPKWLQLVGSRFARFLLFQIAKNRTQVATKRSRKSMWDLNQNRRQKVFTIAGFTFAYAGHLTFWKCYKISTDYSVSYFNLEGMLPVATGVFQTSWAQILAGNILTLNLETQVFCCFSH